MTSPDFSSTMTSNVIFPKKNTDLKVALLLSRSLGLHSHQVKMCLSMKIQKVPNKEGTKIMFMSHESLHLYMTVGNWCASGYCLVSPKIFLQVSHGRFPPHTFHQSSRPTDLQESCSPSIVFILRTQSSTSNQKTMKEN